jgi:hypothetical protein
MSKDRCIRIKVKGEDSDKEMDVEVCFENGKIIKWK